MPPADWASLEDAFNDILDRPPAERQEALRAVCAERPDLAEELIDLLEHYEEAPDFLEAPAELAPQLGQPEIGSQIGPYVLTRLLGHGGMGSVFEARRADEAFEKTVAVKVVRSAVVTPAVVEQFRQERQILATLDHPNIARLLDGGVTSEGTPYLVMDLVVGAERIDEHLRGRPLGKKLQLFVEVCDAVAHAHGNLVVHRDLKPSNILVDGDGRPKLVDFGIAKILDVGDGSPSATRARAFTPSCASPEQIRGDAITVRSDVYALGVLLHHLLTGRAAYDLDGRSPLEVAKMVCETDPPSPSRVTGDRTLAGDLDIIVAKAMRKEAAGRYESAAALRDDVVRYLERRPISARPAGALYVVGKLVRRHRVAAFASVLALIAIGAGTAVAVWQGKVARAQRDQARVAAQTAKRITGFLITVFESANPMQSEQASDVPVGVIVRRGERLLASLENEPETRAELLGVLGRVNAALGDYHHARGLLEQSLELRRSLYRRPHRALADAEHDMGRIEFLLGRRGEAAVIADGALKHRTEAYGKAHPKVGASMILLCRATRQVESTSTTDLCWKGLAIIDRGVPAAHPARAKAQKHVADVLRERGFPEDARELYDRALEAAVARDPNHYVVAAIRDGRSDVLHTLGDLDGATRDAVDALRIKERWLGARHPAVADSLVRVGASEYARRRHDRALSSWSRALRIRREALGGDSAATGVVRWLTAMSQFAMGKRSEAAGGMRDFLASAPVPVTDDLMGSDVLLARAIVGLDEGNTRESCASARRAKRLRADALGDDDPSLTYANTVLATCE